MKEVDISGKTFGRLTAIKLHHRNKRGVKYWEFLCSCGKKHIAAKNNATSGATKSCGCLKKEKVTSTEHIERCRIMGQATATHGRYKGINRKMRLESIYAGIIQRCTDKGCQKYKDYGGRGIKNLWISVAAFKRDMEDDYNKHISLHGRNNTEIDRTDNDGDYCKENCRWVTRETNANNKRNSYKNVVARWLSNKENQKKLAILLNKNQS